MFDEGDLPVKWAHEGAANGIRWTTPVCALDSHQLTHLVPVFFEGLQEVRCQFPLVGAPSGFVASARGKVGVCGGCSNLHAS